MASELESPLSPDKDEQPGWNGGRNTIISHGGKWHNLKESLGQLHSNVRGSTGAKEAQDERVRNRELDSADTSEILDADAKRQTGYKSPTSDDGYEFFNGKSPDLCSPHLERREAWDMQEQDEEQGTQLSPRKILELASSPLLLPVSEMTADPERNNPQNERAPISRGRAATSNPSQTSTNGGVRPTTERERSGTTPNTPIDASVNKSFGATPSFSYDAKGNPRPRHSTRTASTPLSRNGLFASKGDGSSKHHDVYNTKMQNRTPIPVDPVEAKSGSRFYSMENPEASPMPAKMPMPPLSLSTFLQLELSSYHPSSIYIHRSAVSDSPYESSRVKLERLMNFFLLPPQLERVLGFGALACLDAWLYSFTILPLRFLKALVILGDSWSRNFMSEIQFIGSFIYTGLGRMWLRKRWSSSVRASGKTAFKDHDSDEDIDKAYHHSPIPVTSGVTPETKHDHSRSSARRHRRSKSTPSALLPDHKTDILKGLLIILTCVIMMSFDPSRMYHGIRGQAAIKLYVIYNVLEVCDRLFSALGQDVLECLFSKETLERKSDGRSKILRPLWLFVLALTYNLIHATALFYQVITLNVAVNSYSNALLTLLLSNQFVEIKSTVFKKFEKENLFQITCADVVERFQLWLMLTIIASRNIVETGSLMPSSSSDDDFSAAFLPKAFTLEVVPFLSGQVIGPYLIVLGSEMLVDWLKHAYITKFNMTKPAIYGRFLDVLCKDYYSDAFATQNLTRRIGLPVIPLACLFIRASIQTYHMFVATHMPSPLPPPSASTSISVPTPTALLPEALSSFLNNFLPDTPTHIPFTTMTPDALLTLLTIALAFLLIYLALLSLKLLLGMALLHFARTRYRGMKELEEKSFEAEGRRFGGLGVVEVDEDKKRWIYADDPDGLSKSRERDNQWRKTAAAGGGGDFMNVDRYSMVAKRIW